MGTEQKHGGFRHILLSKLTLASLALGLGACGTDLISTFGPEAGESVYDLHGIQPQEIHPESVLRLSGNGFPAERDVLVHFRGELVRPAKRPKNVHWIARGRTTNTQEVRLVPPRRWQGGTQEITWGWFQGTATLHVKSAATGQTLVGSLPHATLQLQPTHTTVIHKSHGVQGSGIQQQKAQRLASTLGLRLGAVDHNVPSNSTPTGSAVGSLAARSPATGGVTTGVGILRVEPGSLADQSGLREGDIVTAALGFPLHNPGDFRVIQGQERIDLTVVRNGTTKSVTIGTTPFARTPMRWWYAGLATLFLCLALFCSPLWQRRTTRKANSTPFPQNILPQQSATTPTGRRRTSVVHIWCTATSLGVIPFFACRGQVELGAVVTLGLLGIFPFLAALPSRDLWSASKTLTTSAIGLLPFGALIWAHIWHGGELNLLAPTASTASALFVNTDTATALHQVNADVNTTVGANPWEWPVFADPTYLILTIATLWGAAKVATTAAAVAPRASTNSGLLASVVSQVWGFVAAPLITLLCLGGWSLPGVATDTIHLEPKLRLLAVIIFVLKSAVVWWLIQSIRNRSSNQPHKTPHTSGLHRWANQLWKPTCWAIAMVTLPTAFIAFDILWAPQLPVEKARLIIGPSLLLTLTIAALHQLATHQPWRHLPKHTS